MALAGRVADKAGIDRAAEFLDKAGSVVGMASKAVGSPGDVGALVKTGVGAGAEELMGPVAGKLATGELDPSKLLEQATGLSGHLEEARAVASAVSEGGSLLGREGLGILGGVAKDVAQVAMEDKTVVEQVEAVIGEGQAVLGGLEAGISDVADLAQQASTSRGLASAILGGQGDGMEALGRGLAQAMAERVDGGLGEGVSSQGVMEEAVVAMRQLVGLAMNSPTVVGQLEEVMGQIGEFHDATQQAGALQYQRLSV